MQLDELQYRILMVLCWCCRGASMTQLTAVTQVSRQAVEAAVRSLRKLRLVSGKTLSLARFAVCEPLVVCGAGEQCEDFGGMAWEMERRWRTATRKATPIVWSTPLAIRIVGGVSGRLRQPLQIQHDLGVTEVYACRRIAEGERWIGEDAYRVYWETARGTKAADAAILNRAEEITRVIEFGGRYSRRRLEAFHHFWAIRNSMPYEIW